MANKINYYEQSLKEFESLGNQRPKILVHACCGPCATFPLIFLSQHFEVTILFNNSNIYPKAEHDRRYEELLRLVKELNEEEHLDIHVLAKPYDNETYNQDLEPFADEPEGLHRCRICYAKRMNEAYQFASENGFPWFTTVMTISRQKDSQILNQIGAALQHRYPNTRYFFSDFKKNKGIDIAREMRLEHHLYQQLYCGCKYTYAKGEEKKRALEKNDYEG